MVDVDVDLVLNTDLLAAISPSLQTAAEENSAHTGQINHFIINS